MVGRSLRCKYIENTQGQSKRHRYGALEGGGGGKAARFGGRVNTFNMNYYMAFCLYFHGVFAEY